MKDDHTDAVWLTAPQVARRYNISSMALWRWLHDPELEFPHPVRIRMRNYWRIEEIVAWERLGAARAAGKRSSAHKREEVA